MTFFIIKPDAVGVGLTDDIVNRIEYAGLAVRALYRWTYTRSEARDHYRDHAGQDYFEPMVEFLASGSSWVGFASQRIPCPNDISVIEILRKLVGTYADPAEGTIRGDYRKNRTFENLIHSSDSPEAAAREAAICGIKF